MQKFDLIVIGAGSGLSLAVDAAEKGAKVAVIEKGPMGGTCLNRGCIPSKIVIHSADVAEMIDRAKEFGLTASLKRINFKFITDRANKTVDKDARMIEKGLTSGKNPKLFKGTAKFIDKKVIEVNGEKLSANRFVIAAGARPFIPPIPGLDKIKFMTSTEALRQTKLPKSMIVIGGGYIGCELGNFYAALGCKVTILQRGPLLLPREDQDVAKLITKLWKNKKNINLILNANASKVEKKGGKIVVWYGKKKVIAEKLLVSTGVKPNTDLLDVSKSGIKVNKRGFIKINKFMETSVKGIWALGDIAGIYMFKHSANLEAEYIFNSIFSKRVAVNYYPMPHAVFTSPQIAGVGLTEQDCIKKGIKYKVGIQKYAHTGMGLALAEKDGFVKVIAKGKEILGCHIIGPEASILLHEVLVAMKANRKKALDIIAETVHIHPAMSEVVQRAVFRIPV